MSRSDDHESARGPQAGVATGQDYREALAQWRLDVRTQCKRVSSLPTTMFDATDPMLEMRLAEVTETMLHELRSPDIRHMDPEMEDLRLEPIDDTELRLLPERFRSRDTGQVDLLSHLADEYLGILADACQDDDPMLRRQAAGHLTHDFGVTSALVDETISEIRQTTIAANADADCERTDYELDAALTQVATTLRQFFAPAAEEPDPEPEPEPERER